MGKHTERLLKNRILHLSDVEITDPIGVADDFFSAAQLPDHLKMLKRWRNCAAFESYRSRIGNPATLLFNYELTVKLVEAAWLLKNGKIGNLNLEASTDMTAWYIKKERKKLGDYPKQLKLTEIIHPSSVLKKMFKDYKLCDYQNILKIWLYDSLGKNFMEESLSKSDVIKVYEQLIRLFEAMWLVSARSKHIELTNHEKVFGK